MDTKAGLCCGSTYGKFPDYDICPEEVNDLANGSAHAGRAPETGFARLSDIPEELKGEDAGEKRAAWLIERLPDFYKGIVENQRMAQIADFQATATPTKFTEMLASESYGGTGERAIAWRVSAACPSPAPDQGQRPDRSAD